MFDLLFNFIKDFIFKSSTLDANILNSACTIITIIILCLIIVLFIRLVMWAFYIVYRPFKGRKR